MSEEERIELKDMDGVKSVVINTTGPSRGRDWLELTIRLLTAVAIPVGLWWGSNVISDNQTRNQSQIAKLNRIEDQQMKILELVWDDLSSSSSSAEARQLVAVNFFKAMREQYENMADTASLSDSVAIVKGPLFIGYKALLYSIDSNASNEVLKSALDAALKPELAARDAKAPSDRDTARVVKQDDIKSTTIKKITDPFVYIQYTNGTCKGVATELSDKFKSEGFVSPGVELVSGFTGSQSEVRYFHESDKETAEKVKAIAESITKKSVRTVPIKLPSAIEGQVELWLGKEVCEPTVQKAVIEMNTKTEQAQKIQRDWEEYDNEVFCFIADRSVVWDDLYIGANWIDGVTATAYIRVEEDGNPKNIIRRQSMAKGEVVEFDFKGYHYLFTLNKVDKGCEGSKKPAVFYTLKRYKN